MKFYQEKFGFKWDATMGTMKFWDMAGRFNMGEKLVVPVDGTRENFKIVLSDVPVDLLKITAK
jgi:hypothetical protein